MSAAVLAPPPRLGRRLSDLVMGRRALLLLLLLAPPLLWLGVIYLGSLFTLLANSFLKLDEFSGLVVPEFTLQNFAEIFAPANLDAVRRTVTMALSVTLACALIAFPLAWYMARYASGSLKALLYIAVMLPLWSSYLVRLYAWKLLLAKEGAVSWVFERLHLGWMLDAVLSIPGIGGSSLSFSALGTFLVFVYLWLPFMILPIQAAIERIPTSYIEASGDLGASPRDTLRRVIVPLAMPGIAAGSIFTFSLTLGDYIVPQVIGDSTLYIGQVVYRQQGVAGNLPFAAAFSTVPIVVIAVYLRLARRLGAFDAL
ncbi:MAG TPA: ABC transporter permease [Burkholderiaceae bacterium]|jgi:putative spermidine/putrescine transport system permease protein|nr:ABC transporter permease [Burkholderiaceae bacterium]HRA77404.1 ABC transporter permease [Burkholderiaceae bacterium]